MVAQEAETRDEMAECLTVALTRDRLTPALKQYVDTTRRFKFREYLETCEEWECNQPRGTSCFRKSKASTSIQGGRSLSSPYPQKPVLKCFLCGKMGHFTRDCGGAGNSVGSSTSSTPSISRTENTSARTAPTKQRGQRRSNCPIARTLVITTPWPG